MSRCAAANAAEVLGVSPFGRWGAPRAGAARPLFADVLAAPRAAARARTTGCRPDTASWTRAAAGATQRRPSLGPLVEFDFGREVVGYLQLAVRSRPRRRRRSASASAPSRASAAAGRRTRSRCSCRAGATGRTSSRGASATSRWRGSTASCPRRRRHRLLASAALALGVDAGARPAGDRAAARRLPIETRSGDGCEPAATAAGLSDRRWRIKSRRARTRAPAPRLPGSPSGSGASALRARAPCRSASSATSSQRALAPHQLEDLAPARRAHEGAVLEHRSRSCAALGGGDPRQEQQERQRQLALLQVREHRLAELALAGGEVEQVVDELEADAELRGRSGSSAASASGARAAASAPESSRRRRTARAVLRSTISKYSSTVRSIAPSRCEREQLALGHPQRRVAETLDHLAGCRARAPCCMAVV